MPFYYTYRDIKGGITEGYPTGRLSTYQIAHGYEWEARFTWLLYVEKLEDVEFIEKSVMSKFGDKRCAGSGMTEWFMDLTLDEIRDHVLKVCEDTNIKYIDYGKADWTRNLIREKIPRNAKI